MGARIVHIKGQPALGYGDAHTDNEISFVFGDDGAVEVDGPAPSACRALVSRADLGNTRDVGAAAGTVAAGGAGIPTGPTTCRLCKIENMLER